MLFAAANRNIYIATQILVNKYFAQSIGETWNTVNPLHVLQTRVSKDPHAHNSLNMRPITLC